MKNLQEAVAYWNKKIAQDFGTRPEIPVEQCNRLRQYGYEPYKFINIYGFEAEIISYPFPSEFGASIKVREKGDPTTITEAALNPSVLKYIAA